MSEFIENKVANSGLITISLEEFHQKGERVLFDIKPLLWQELALKEKDFRSFIKQHDWRQYQDNFVAITCSADAIVPTWAYMLVAIALQPYVKKVIFGNLSDLERELYIDAINLFDLNSIANKRVLVKGCGDINIPDSAFVYISQKFVPVVKSLMFGEACSNVPLYKEAK
jgi:hypothetical protein